MTSALGTNEVTVLYEDVLFRAPDPVGLSFWSNSLDAGQTTLQQAIGAFVESQEAIDNIYPIIRLYFGLFGRPPDLGGLAGWVGSVDAGMSLNTVAKYFVSSAEFYDDYGTGTLTNPTAFLYDLYANFLGRAPDPAGLSGWLAVLGNAPTVAAEATVALAFANSTEFIGDLGSKVSGWLTKVADDALTGDATVTLTTGSGGSLVTSEGTWTFSTATAVGGEEILLNGQSAAGGTAMELFVVGQDQVYAQTTQGNWYEWGGSAWSATANPIGAAGNAGPQVTDTNLVVAESGHATAIDIPTPSDANFATSQLMVTVEQLPTDGTLLLANGSTALTVGESLTVAQLTSLEFLPATDISYQTSTFTYEVTDPAGLTATGTETLSVDVAGGSAPLSQTVTAPTIPQPTQLGDVVGLILQNNQSTTLAAREITFGEVLGAGLVPAGSQLEAIVNGIVTPVQMDIKTTNADGSASSVVLTMVQPTLAANSSTDVMLAIAPSGAPVGTSVNIANLTEANYGLMVSLTLHNSDGTNTNYQIDAAQVLQQALASGSASYWLDGPQATQVRVDVPIAGSLHVTMDITDYADGTTSTDVEFNNDYAMTANGGAANYDIAVSQNGQVAFQQNNINQAQYTTWDTTVYSNGAPQVNVQEDIQAVENTGAIQAYDLTTGVPASTIATDSARLGEGGFGVLQPGFFTQYMPTTGGRPDIGTEPAWMVDWLMTQNQSAATYALAQTEAGGSIPWHLFDPNTGMYLTIDDDPRMFLVPGAAMPGNDVTLTQPISTNTGWVIDVAHEPDVAYVAYIMTGDRYYLDQLNAEASYDVIALNANDLTIFGTAEGVVTPSTTQVRASAWALREVVEAAFINPDGSAEKAYFTQVMNDNFSYLLNQADNANEGQVSGWIEGINGTNNGIMAPWQQDYFATTVVLAAEQGSQPATHLLAWETNFLAGLFLSAADGFSPFDGAAYQLNLYTEVPQTGSYDTSEATNAYQTWEQVEAATQAAGNSRDGTWANMESDYGAVAAAALAGDITVSESPDAMQAYAWVLHQLAAPGVRGGDGVTTDGEPQFDIVPRLPDGSYLTATNLHLFDDTAGTTNTFQFGDADQLIYAGAGNDTLIGGSGTNLLFAGSGNDSLEGGSGADYLFGGSGTETISAGPGTNFMRAGTGPDTFEFNASDVATDTIDRFKVGTDQLLFEAVTGNNLTASDILAGATTDVNGNVVLHLSAQHSVVLIGIAPGELTASMIVVA